MRLRHMLIAAVVLMKSAAASEPAPQLDLTGSVQIQAQRSLRDDGIDNNLDDFWGRANFGAQYKSSDFASCINIRAFPEGWGFEALSLNVKDSLVVSQRTTPIARFIIEQAWVKYTFSPVEIRIGRYFTSTSKTIHMGNYLDQSPGPGFQAKLSYHHAVDVSTKTGPFTSTLLLGAGDKKLNTGYLRLYESATLLKNKSLNLGAGYRVNVFDFVQNPDVELEHRIAFNADYEVLKGLRPYVEIGIHRKIAKDTYDAPVVIGTFIPGGKLFNAIGAEIEILNDRQAKTRQGEMVDAAVHWNLYLDKKFGSRTRFQLGFFSDPLGTAADLQAAVRYTGSLK